MINLACESRTHDLGLAMRAKMEDMCSRPTTPPFQPLLDRLNEVGVEIASPQVQTTNIPGLQDEKPAQALRRRAPGDTVGHTLIASRLFQRSNYDKPRSLEEMHQAIRSVVEDGAYEFHGMNYSPTLAVAGNPDNAIHPAFRSTIMHAQAYEPSAWWTGSTVLSSSPLADLKVRHDRLQRFMQLWRDITPGSGSYMNEGDMQEKEWKDAFYGSNYPRLLKVKRKWDPEELFYVHHGVGSEGWVVEDGDRGVQTQDGKLCRV